MEVSNLYVKHLYRNKDILFLFSKEIIEYDISQAGYSLIREYNLLPDEKIKKLESLSKEERHRKIGIFQKKDRDFDEKLKQAFIDIRKRFFEANELEDDDILSIKKDAIFALRLCNKVDFGYVHFAEKNQYSSYMFLNNCEFLYNPKKMDVKGISDELLPEHQDYMLNFIQTCFRHFETSTQEVQLRYLRRFIDRYKAKDLSVGYYRRLDIYSYFILKDDDELHFNTYWEDRKHELDIDYNFRNYIIPITKIAL